MTMRLGDPAARTGYAGIPADWEGRHDPPGSLPERVHARLRRRLVQWSGVLRPGARVLDLGCGRGDLLAHLAEDRPDLRLCGLDDSEDMLRIGRGRGPRSSGWVRGDARNIPFKDGSFDLVTALDLLPHFEAGPEALAFLREALRVTSEWAVLEIKNPLTLSLLRFIRRMAGPGSNAGILRYFLGWDIHPAGHEVHVHHARRLLEGCPVVSVLGPWPILPAPGALYVLRKER